jgi:hypothetical protein
MWCWLLYARDTGDRAAIKMESLEVVRLAAEEALSRQEKTARRTCGRLQNTPRKGLPICGLHLLVGHKRVAIGIDDLVVRVRNRFFRAIALKEVKLSETREKRYVLRHEITAQHMITLYNCKTERIPRYSNPLSINLWNCPSAIQYTVKPINSYRPSDKMLSWLARRKAVATPLLSRLVAGWRIKLNSPCFRFSGLLDPVPYKPELAYP